MQGDAQDHLQLVWGWGSQHGWQHNGLALPDADLPLRQEAPSQQTRSYRLQVLGKEALRNVRVDSIIQWVQAQLVLHLMGQNKLALGPFA